MKIQQFSQQGKRSNNEDSLGTSAALLTVCDGMGGHNYGERASAFVVQAMLKAFDQPQPIGKMEIQQQLNKVQADINQLLEKEPELEKMGTTFTGIFITPDVWYAAHIGDSRIYLFRPSEQKLWHTWDHSLVGELMRTKEITVEAGRFHPMSNRIAKAIIAQKEGKPSSASIVKIDELKAGDVFMLCSDGVVEGWGDHELVQLFSDSSLSFEQKCKKLAKQCDEKSKDNNTALIVEIEEQDAFSFGSNSELEWTTFAEVEADYRQYLADNMPDSEPQKREEAPRATPVVEETPQSRPYSDPMPSDDKGGGVNKKPILIILGTVLLLAGIGLYFLLGSNPEKREFDKCETIEQYEEYIKNYGEEGKYYDQAVNKIAELKRENPSSSDEKDQDKPKVNGSDDEAKAAQKVEEEKEMEALKKIRNIADCDAYLKDFPDGKYVEDVKTMKSNFEDDECFGRCNNLKDYRYYKSKYPKGRHVAEAEKEINKLEKSGQGTNATPATTTKPDAQQPAATPDASHQGAATGNVNQPKTDTPDLDKPGQQPEGGEPEVTPGQSETPKDN